VSLRRRIQGGGSALRQNDPTIVQTRELHPMAEMGKGKGKQEIEKPYQKKHHKNP
jgi:hypothetical protein